MNGGYTGKILRLNLTNHTTSIMNTSDYEEYGGGIGIGTAIFWDLVEDKSIDAFDPRNVITLMSSPLSGTLTPGACGRTEVNGIGPQAYPIGWFTRGSMGGRFSSQMKFAGWDGIVIEGKADSPVWVKIVNDEVTFEDANDLWGLDTFATQEKIWREANGGQKYGEWLQIGLEEDRTRTTARPAVVCIGPIGEVKCRIASLIHDAACAVGQGGFGAVFGAKNLKAISVIGTGSINVAHPQALMDARIWLKKNFALSPEVTYYKREYMAGIISWTKPPGTDVLASGFIAGNAGVAFLAPEASGGSACLGCSRCCRPRVASGEGNQSNCVDYGFYKEWAIERFGRYTHDFNKAVDLPQRYGINNYAVRRGINWLWGLNQKGICGRGKAIDTDLPFDLIGEAKFLEILFDKIVKGKDIGLDLREGFVRAAEKWGRLEEDWKTGLLMFPYWGYPEHGYDPRTEILWGYSTIVGDRDVNEHGFNYPFFWYPIQFEDYTDSSKLPITAQEMAEICAEKLIPFEGDPLMLDMSTKNQYSEHLAKLTAWQRYYSRFWLQGIQYCDFGWPNFINALGPNKRGATPEGEVKFFNAVTGKNITFADGMKIGRKVWNIQNAIWTLQGRHRDMLKFAPYIYDLDLDLENGPRGAHGRLISWGGLFSTYPQPVFENGKWSFKNMFGRKVDRDRFEDWKTIYYKLEGWDTSTGWPKRSTLEGLGLGFVADELERRGKLLQL